MIFRGIILVAGLAGGLGAAQFPAYSQQYVQRLGGAVSALETVVADFDASAGALGLTRAEALEQMQGAAFVEARRQDMERAFARHDVLRQDLSVLEGLGPFMRAYHIRHFADPEVARGTWAAFEPALPLGFASLMFACFGGLATVLGLNALARLMKRKGRMRAQSA